MSLPRRHLLVAAFVVWVSAGVAAPTGATVCDVPSQTYSTIQSAVDDPQCTEIDVAAGRYREVVAISRSLSISGAGSENTTIDVPAGQPLLGLSGVSTFVEIHGITLGCLGPCPGLTVTDGARLEGTDTGFFTPQRDVVFAAGFEVGTTDEWSQATP